MRAACCLLMAGVANAAAAGDRRPVDAGPAASAADIPALADLLERAGWEPTPELSGVFKTGAIFREDGLTHSLMVRACFDAPEARDTYTSAEVVSQLQAGVRVKFGLGGMQASGELTKKVKFGAPVHATIERLAMTPNPACAQMLANVSQDEIGKMYAVQEVLTAEIAEQTCGRMDASGRFVGIGAAEAELAQACMQESLEPVAVAYRVVPLSEFVKGNAVTMVPAPPADCPFGAVNSFSVPSLGTVAINGDLHDVRGLDRRTQMSSDLARCVSPDAAVLFDKWRAARRTTNIASSTLVGFYPFGIGIASAYVAKKNKEELIQVVTTGMTDDQRKQAEKAARRSR